MYSKIGICTKCKEEKPVIQHHTKGYEGNNKDYTLPYCLSCHRKIHIKARKLGMCNIPVKVLKRLSMRSGHRRYQKEKCRGIHFTETMMPNIQLFETILVYQNSIYISSYFQAQHGKNIYEIQIL